jgi:hypothetical protein
MRDPEYAECPRCGAVVLEVRHLYTASRIMIDALPVIGGDIWTDGSHWRKENKPKGMKLWNPHVRSCGETRTDRLRRTVTAL